MCRAQVVVKKDPGDRAGGQVDAELQELALDATIAPPSVLFCEAHDERGGLGVHLGASGLAMRVGPAPGHQPAVPGEQRGWRHTEARPPIARE